MDYSPSPSRVKLEYTFLDNNVENSEYISGKRPGSKSAMNDRQKRFYAKYSDLKSPMKKKDMQVEGTTTNSRLFRTINNEQVPIGDVFKIQSNMVEKLIKEKKVLQNKHKEMIEIADNFKIKLTKYKTANDDLKEELTKIKDQNEFLNKKSEEMQDGISELKKQNEALMKEIADLKAVRANENIEYTFNPDNTNDIFLDQKESKKEEVVAEKEESKNDDRNRMESKLDHFIQEFEFFKELTLQQQNPDKSSPLESESSTALPKKTLQDIDLITSETKEVQELQDQVDGLKHQLAVREENKLRKYKLKCAIAELSSKLNSDELPKELKTPVESPQKLTKTHSGCPVCKDHENSRNNSTNNGDVDATKWY